MAIYVLIAVIVLIVGLYAFISTRPSNIRIERKAHIKAPQNVVFSIINDLHVWSRWSPWDKLDPNMQKSFEGPNTGPGASHTWNGNKKVGEGRLTIQESKPDELISMKLDFIRPFKCTNQVYFRLVPFDGGTQVSWIMEGQNNFMAKAMSVCINMDKMVGKDFEQGLVNLNNVAQAELQKA